MCSGHKAPSELPEPGTVNHRERMPWSSPRFEVRAAGNSIAMGERASRIAKAVAKRGASAAGRGASAAGRDVAKLAGRATRAGYDAASIERCEKCGEPVDAGRAVCPHCGHDRTTRPSGA